MRPPSLPIRRIAIGTHPDQPEALQLGQEICRLFTEHGAETIACAPLNSDDLREKVNHREVDMLVALGGDGTMLRAGRLCAPIQMPVLGINLGHFGFLMELHGDQWRKAIPQLLNGMFHLEDRMMLRVEHWRDEQMLDTWDVLNEVVVSHGKHMRPIRIHTEVDGYLLTTYVADALIVSTPTGSTAYALAAGGPILPPELRNILIVPLAPHLTADRPVVLSEGACVKITVYTYHDACLSVDGHYPVDVSDGDVVTVEAARNVVTFVRMQDPGYFYRNLMRYMAQNPSSGANNERNHTQP